MEIINFDHTHNLIFFCKNGQIYKARYLAPTHTYPTPALYLFNTNQIITLTLSEQKTLPKKEIAHTVFQEKITSPICGRVVAVHVQAAQAVNAQEPLVTIESMKMENEILAPCSLFVKNISISCGDLVEQNHVLLTVTQPKKEG